MGWLSTHVLDTANGCPAADMELILWKLIPLSDAGSASLGDGNSTAEKTISDSSEKSKTIIRFQSKYQHLKTLRTNQDGRTETPLLENEDFHIGFYEIIFAVGDYFSAIDPQRSSNVPMVYPFLDLVPIRFGIEDASTHYHVPLLVSPWSYSTYRGS